MFLYISGCRDNSILKGDFPKTSTTSHIEFEVNQYAIIRQTSYSHIKDSGKQTNQNIKIQARDQYIINANIF